MKVLDVAQRELGRTTTTSPGQTLLDTLILTQKQLNIKGRFSRYESELVAWVNKILESVIRHGQLAPLVVGYLRRLQVPLLKIALLDQRFLNQAQHPARELLNELAVSAASWQHTDDPQLQSPVITTIDRITRTIIEDFTDDIRLIEQLLTQLLSSQGRSKHAPSY